MAFLILVYGKTVFKQFWLPKERNCSYTAVLYKDYFGLTQTASLNLENKEGEWYIDEQKMEEGQQYEVFTENKEKMTVHFMKKEDFSFYRKYRLKNNFCIGRGSNNDVIACCGEIISRKHAVITLTESIWEINNCSINGLYVNGRYVREKKSLSYGDIIYIPGMYLIFLGDYIAAESWGSDSGGLIRTGESEVFSVAEGKRAVMKEKVFHRAPRLMEEIDQTPIEIEAPPAIREKQKESVFMKVGSVFNMTLPMLIMSLFMIYAMREEQGETGIYMYSGLIMAVVSILFSTVWIFVTENHEKKADQKEKKKNIADYRQYLKEKTNIIEGRYQETRKILNSRYLHIDRYLCGKEGQAVLWNRNPYHEDFLKFRMGTGDQNFQTKVVIAEESFELSKNKLWMETRKIKGQYGVLYQMPVLLDLKKYEHIGIVGNTDREKNYIVRNLVAQIVWNDCYTEVKLAFVYDKNLIFEEGEWDFCRWLPHVWSADRKYRFIADDKESARRLFYQLMKIFKEREIRKQEEENGQLPHFILFIAKAEYLEGEMFSRYIFNSGRDYGLTVIWIEKTREGLPNSCNVIVENNDIFSGWYNTNRKSKEKREVRFDYIEREKIDNMARWLSPLKVPEIEENRDIPGVVDFLGIYAAKRPEDLKIEERWKKNKIYESIRAEIGKKAGGMTCFLDIHEKYHGPHGLLAGTTGSGKSEVLQTYILSLAVNFSPKDINFFLIDYKGEGMSGMFSDLPHVCGKISNLSGGLAYRAMVSVKSENRRRQKIFKDNRVNNINEYSRRFHEGMVREPLPHLLIIIDEFAELKKEQPEFMEELISVAQVGRSLGVHLILATQKPGGIVDDKIWSNSRFHICLKVQERQDSMEMLRNSDACNITQTGRGYLQVGNNEVYELFQAGWSGAEFCEQEPASEIAKLITIDGEEDKEGAVKEPESGRETSSQLEVVKEHIKQIALKAQFQKGRSLWLKPLPKKLYLSEVKERNCAEIPDDENRTPECMRKECEKNSCRAYIGIFDDPAEQQQPVFMLDLLVSGHIFVCGGSGSGKSVFLQTLVYSLLDTNTPEDLQLYILDYSGGLMSSYALAPHVGEVIGGEEKEKIRRLFLKMESSLKIRKKLLGGGNLRQYRQAGGEAIPMLAIVIDSLAEFYENDGRQYEYIINILLREGEKTGINLIVSSSAFSVPGVLVGMKDYFKTKICLSMRDVYSYGEAFGMIQAPVLPERGVSGRGIARCRQKILEFQTALAIKSDNDYDRLRKITEIMKQKNMNWDGCRAEKIKVIPQRPKWDIFLNAIEENRKSVEQKQRKYNMERAIQKTKENDERIYIGYDDRNAEIYGVPLRRTYCFLIIGHSKKRIHNFVRLLISTPKKEGTEVYVIDFKREILLDERKYFYIENEESLFQFFEKLTPLFMERSREKRKNREKKMIKGKKTEYKEYFIIIADMEKFLHTVYEGTFEMKGFLENVWGKGEGCGIYFWGAVNSSNAASLKGYRAFHHFCLYKDGILLDGTLFDNAVFTFEGTSFEKQSERLKNREAFLVARETETIKLVIPEVADDI